MRYSLGLDVGTTGLKGVLADEAGVIVASASAEYPSSSRWPGWSEQDPAHWWIAARTVCRRLWARASPADRLSGIGLSGQMHGSVFLDGGGDVLYPAILWNDQRTADECRQILELTAGRIGEWTLNPPRTAFTATKVLWLRHHRPDVYEQVRHLLLPKDYVRYRLTGAFASDVTDASGTNLLDVRGRRWSQATLDALDIPRSWLPDLVESCELSGLVSEGAARATGLPAGTPVVGGGADQAAAAIGNGVTRSGITSLTLGTSGVVYVQIEDVTVDPSGAFHTFCHAVPGTWQMMAGVLSAGGSYRWYRDVVAGVEAAQALQAGRDPYDVISEAAADVPPGAEGLVFLPYLTGERSPHNDPEARGGWLGVTARHRRPHLARAVLEGASFALRDLVEVLTRLGVPIHEVRVAGGGANGSLWLRILADVLQRSLVMTTSVDASAYGAAILAAAHGLDADVTDVADAWVRTRGVVEPDTAHADVYDDYFAVYTDLYPATSASMHRLSALAERASRKGGPT